ncbi:hypothetical protein E3E12_04520 [Formicincola oecophyllae]|uniref:Uncharacterized protein n=1 Tax=Formicincola oecophyllae TaxID=2558361 RepID=A0A4Y6U994_9PROT|nr:hypothetical protein [Formicincola oecophyllae]QDH13580.1 hypothetical protein E3E12_04520 [Formicincola oecophyllae]
MKRHLFGVVALLSWAAMVTWPTDGRAADKHRLGAGTHLSAEALDITAPCTQVRIKVDAALGPGGQNAITADDIHGAGALYSLVVVGDATRLDVSVPACAPDNRLVLRIGPSVTLSLHESPHGMVTVTGPLSSLEGRFDTSSFNVARTAAMEVVMGGQGTGHVGELGRAAQIDLTGQAQLDISHTQAAVVSAQVGQNATLNIGSGHIGALTLNATGHAQASVAAQSGTANAQAHDQATVRLGPSGNLTSSGDRPILPWQPPQPAIPAANASQPQQAQTLPKPTAPQPPLAQGQPTGQQLVPTNPAPTPTTLTDKAQSAPAPGKAGQNAGQDGAQAAPAQPITTAVPPAPHKTPSPMPAPGISADRPQTAPAQPEASAAPSTPTASQPQLPPTAP